MPRLMDETHALGHHETCLRPRCQACREALKVGDTLVWYRNGEAYRVTDVVPGKHFRTVKVVRSEPEPFDAVPISWKRIGEFSYFPASE